MNATSHHRVVEYMLEKMPYVFMPYENRLARLEAKIIFDSRPVSKAGRLAFAKRDKVILANILDRLTYFSSVTMRTDGVEETHATRQALIEKLDALTKRRMNGVYPISGISDSAVKYKWQARRYFSHGIHEYKGKYHPQIVKFTFNLLKLKPGNAIIDPFCGCGTTLVEAFVNDYDFLGVDVNPLAIWIARTKIEALHSDINKIESEYASLVARTEQLQKSCCIPDASSLLPKENLEYLKQWFNKGTLSTLLTLSAQISESDDPCAKNLFNVTLSDILRIVSLQEPGQLRIRRRRSCDPDPPVLQIFFARLRRSMDSIKNFYELNVHRKLGSSDEKQILSGDVRHISRLLGGVDFDAAIFSPPYATALPYIDTDRLSLVYFNMASPSSLRTLTRSMIGDREITTSERQRIDDVLSNSFEEIDLPYPIKRLVRTIYTKNYRAKVGFRRKNTAALLYKYFGDMKDALCNIYSVLKPSGACAFIVGNNTTIAGNTKIIIPTARFLAMISRNIGFKDHRTLTLNTYPRTEIHSKNSVREESLIVLSK